MELEDQYGIGSVLKDIATGKLKGVSDETEATRFAVCKSCAFFTKWVSTCQVCGCFMPIKTKLAKSSCPIGNWAAESEEQHT